MAWTYSGIILLLGLLSHTEYVNSCDDECKDDLVQRFENLLDKKINVLEKKLTLKMEHINNTLTQKLNDILENMEKINQYMTGADNEVEGCPAGFFNMSTQCFRMSNKSESQLSWLEAKTECEQEGFILAQPDEAVAVDLRKYLFESFGNSDAWLGAQGDGSTFVFAHGGLALDNASPLWYTGLPLTSSDAGTERCLMLHVDEYALTSHPTGPYATSPCSKASFGPRFALCEVK
ncbi:unnamed protein product [Meganyctiphanes norvegica]|uniref:C-type lectin domain-containing protein n=1 Tax=Meganyctiphanes norvegica TaxID=48144 RepID=A0AAV2QMQ1_MEGNR